MSSPDPRIEEHTPERAAREIAADRPPGQVAAIAAQIEELLAAIAREGPEFRPDQPVAIGISGGRLRIAFMHPDMGRFFGPAWQMPIGARDSSSRDQIVVLVQPGDDGRITVRPLNPAFREERDWIPANLDCMYPGPEIDNWYSYEGFGTKMAETVLASLGYLTDADLEARRRSGAPLPPSSRAVSANMRRPFSLVGNALTSIRTVRRGEAGRRVQKHLGRGCFGGLRLVSSGAIPRGGFASSSAVTVATQNALNALYELGLSPDDLVELACQAEYGTGVRAGSLDQATEQKGKAGQGTLISSNPKDRYSVLGTYPVPTDRVRILFPYSVDRDREAWRWSAGMYAPQSGPGQMTAGEVRKMTGKAAELAAILLRLPLGLDFFKEIEEDLLANGGLSLPNRLKVYGYLAALPLRVSRDVLRAQVLANKAWYVGQLASEEGLSADAASARADSTFAALFAEWPEPTLRRTTADGAVVTETGVPLRAMVAYLFGEVAKNVYLIHHPDEWVEWVSRSQLGDRCWEVDPQHLPPREQMLGRLDWEAGLTGPALLEAWLERAGARPFDYNRGLDDAALNRAMDEIRSAIAHGGPDPVHTQPRYLEGSSFFRGLALLDLVEAMLKRAFGPQAVALRVNAAGQGDFFQVHIDTTLADPGEVMEFIRRAVYQRFDLQPEHEFVETHPGGGALGVRLARFDQLPRLVALLKGGER